MNAPAPARAGDAVAISLADLGLIRCLVLPLLVGLLPLLGIWAEVEWVHLAFPLLISGAVGDPDKGLETPLTVAGGVALAAAHLINWGRRPSGPACRVSAGSTPSGRNSR